MTTILQGLRNISLATASVSLASASVPLSIYTYFNFFESSIEIDCQPTAENQKIIESNPQLLQGEYKTTLYMPVRFMEIIYGNTLDYRDQIRMKRDIVLANDGENLALDWMVGEIEEKERTFLNFFSMKSAQDNIRLQGRGEGDLKLFDVLKNRERSDKIEKSGNVFGSDFGGDSSSSRNQDFENGVNTKFHENTNLTGNPAFFGANPISPNKTSNAADSRPIVLILPGLSGGSHSNYVQNMAKSLASQGFRPAIFNVRGINLPQITENIFDYRYIKKDVHSVVQFIKKKHPGVNLYFAGFSLGSSIGTSYLAENPGQIKAMACVANPFDVYKAAESLNSFGNRIYS